MSHIHTSTSDVGQQNKQKKQERLHEENLARAKARRTREEAEERDRAIAAAQAADLAKQEAVGCVQRLQKQHAEQVIQPLERCWHWLRRIGDVLMWCA